MRLRRLVGNLSTIALVTALLFWFATTLREDVRQELFNLIDIRVYQAGAQAILSGQPLYEPVLGPLYFVYPPFAGLLFLPMAFVGDGLLKGIWLLSSAGLVAWVVTMAAKETRIRRFVTGNTVWKLSIAAAVTIGPVLDTISLGQVNLLILVLVTADLVLIASGRHPRLAGVLIGLAIAIKLTPLVFVVLLLAVRQFRPALVAVATFGGTVALGFLFLPRASMSFWGGAIVDTDRMGYAAILSNQSWSGALSRHFDGHAPTGWWLLLAGGSGLLGLAVAVLLYRRDHPLPAAGVLGVAACAASPFSWGHHWVWLLLLVAWGAGMTLHNLVARHRAWLAYAALAVATFLLATRYDVPGQGPSPIWALDPERPTGFWAMSYPVLGMALTALIGALAWLRPGLLAYRIERHRSPAGLARSTRSAGARPGDGPDPAGKPGDHPDNVTTTRLVG